MGLAPGISRYFLNEAIVCLTSEVVAVGGIPRIANTRQVKKHAGRVNLRMLPPGSPLREGSAGRSLQSYRRRSLSELLKA